MSLKIVEIWAVILYWMFITPTIVIICKNQEWISWNTLSFWECIATIFLFAISLAFFSWILFIIVMLIYIQVKAWITNPISTVDLENMQRQPSECVIQIEGGIGINEGGSGSEERGDEAGSEGESQPAPSRPAPSLPRKRNKGAAEQISGPSKAEGSQPPPPSYEEIFKKNPI